MSEKVECYKNVDEIAKQFKSILKSKFKDNKS
jgi:hypothetical protein